MDAFIQAFLKEHSYSVQSGSSSPNCEVKEGWWEFDSIIGKFLKEQKIPGASVAVSRNRTLLYQQGYGIAGGSRRTHCDSVFRIASISKPVTAAMILKLCREQNISLDAEVFGKNGILKKYRTKDKRMKKITIRHLLQHSAGWDRDKVGDAVFVRPQCVIMQHPDSSAYNAALLSYAVGKKLQFTPGAWHSYSNLGYLVLGEIAELLSAQPFHHVMATHLAQLNIHNIRLGKKPRAHWQSREVEYFNNREPQVVDSIYLGEGEVLPQYGGMAMESSGSYGGLISDTLSLLKFVHCMEEAVKRSTSFESSEHTGGCSSDLSPVSTRKQSIDYSVYDSQIISSKSADKSMKKTEDEPVPCCYTGEVLEDDILREPKSTSKSESSSQISYSESGNGILTVHSSAKSSPLALYNISEEHVHDFGMDLPNSHCDSLHLQDILNSSVRNSQKTSEFSSELWQCGVSSFINDGIFSRRCSQCTDKKEKMKKNMERQNVTFHNSDLDTKDPPLLTVSQTKETLARPHYENGRDWYGLGWDVQDDGKSWGHTGGMEGSCGTLHHHKSGLNWAFLLNSWAVDCDLNGVMKCALCSVPGLNMYNQNILSCERQQGVKIVTHDQKQIILLGAEETVISNFVAENSGYSVSWIVSMKQDVACVVQRLIKQNTGGGKSACITSAHKVMNNIQMCQYIVIFEKSDIKNQQIVFQQSAEELELVIKKFERDSFYITFLDSFLDSHHNLKFTAVFAYDESQSMNDTVVYLGMEATLYVKRIKQFVKSFYICVQSVTEMKNDELYVSVILRAKSSHFCPFSQRTIPKIPDLQSTTNHNVPNALDINSDKTNLDCDANKILQSTYLSSHDVSKLESNCATHVNEVVNRNVETTPVCERNLTSRKKGKTGKAKLKICMDSAYWVQITPESFLTELTRQVNRCNGLVYAKFFTASEKPFVSGCWFPNRGGNRYHRTAMSKYGLVPELVEAASANVHLQCLSEYREEDGSIYYAAIWFAS